MNLATNRAAGNALRHALHGFAGAAERWAKTRADGATDKELLERIRIEFGIDGGFSGPGSYAYRVKGGARPRFIFEREFEGIAPFELSGSDLVNAVRLLMQIKNPSNPGDMSHENFMTELNRLSPEISDGPLFEGIAA